MNRQLKSLLEVASHLERVLTFAAPQWFNNLTHLDQLLATWEWRSGATPWLVMKAKNWIIWKKTSG